MGQESGSSSISTGQGFESTASGGQGFGVIGNGPTELRTSGTETYGVTFNKDVHESLQTFCDGLLTGLFKTDAATPGHEDDVIKESNVVRKISGQSSKIRKKSEPSNRTFKCDAVMLRKELRESLHEET